MDEQTLRAQIRGYIRSGRLPLASARDGLFGGKGEGGNCDCCGDPITPAQIQYEVEHGAATLQMHLRCYDEWRRESEARGVRPP